MYAMFHFLQYQMTITDDISKTYSDYTVTRDGPLAIEDSNGKYTGKDNNKYRVDNTGFEPSSDVGEYQGAVRTDGYAGGRVELRNIDDVNNATVENRSNVQIHVGGTYVNSEGQSRTTGSLGCFTLGGDNKGNVRRDKFIGDVSGRVLAHSDAGKGNTIIIKIQKRDEKPDSNK